MPGSSTRASLLLFLLPLAVTAQTRHVTAAEVREVQQSAILIDTHNDVPSRTIDGFDIGKLSTTGHTDLVRLREGGVGAVFFSAYVAPDYVQGNHSANRALQMIDTIRHDIVGRYPNDFRLCLTADDIVAAHRDGKIGALIGIEGGHAIEDSLRLLRDYYLLGARYMTLTHENTNDWADSSGDIDNPAVKHHNGLTPFGKEVVREMNRLGMMVDISHVSDKTFWDALAVSSAPLIASHSSCRAISNVPRNMTDEMIAALARKGGVIDINFSCSFVSQKVADTIPSHNPKLAARIRELSGGRTLASAELDKVRAQALADLGLKPLRATLAGVVTQIDHAVKVAGIDHVGIGSDFDGIDCTPVGLDDVSKFPNLTRALLEHGYSPGDIRKIYGGNLLRVMRAVEKTAAR